MAVVLVEDVLDQANDGCVIVVGLMLEPGAHQVGMSDLYVVHFDKKPELCGCPSVKCCVCPVQQLHGAWGLAGEVPIGRPHVVVGEQDMGRWLRHDVRGARHQPGGHRGLRASQTAGH